MKKIFYIAFFCILSLGFTACGKNKWETEDENMGEINIDPSDTESLAVSEEAYSVDISEEYYDLNLDEIVEKENTDAHTLIVHKCTYYSEHNNVVLQGMIHILTENHGRTVTLQVLNSSNEVIATSDLIINEEADADVGFSIEARIENNNYNSDNISYIKLFAR